MKRKAYTGTDITVTFDMSRCIHARNCFLRLPDVFDPAQRPWVQPDAASAEDVAAVVKSCPSGALMLGAGKVTEAPPKLTHIAVTENGPLSVRGPVTVKGAEAEPRAMLCRCGQSGNHPFCDGSHIDAGFTATGEPAPDCPDETTTLGGDVTIKRAPRGPLLVKGNVEITGASGKHIATLDKAFLCRCGASMNKPFCDGSHKDIGFSDAPEG